MCLLKRVLPFALALMVGIALWAVFSQNPLTTSDCSQSMQAGIPTTPPVHPPMLPTAGINVDPALSRDEGYTNRVFSPKEVTQKASILSRAEPQYTEEARSNQVSGTVVLRAVLADDGLVKNIRVVSGLPYGLTEKAVAAARQIKFSPAIKDGHAVSQYIQIEYNFNLF